MFCDGPVCGHDDLKMRRGAIREQNIQRSRTAYEKSQSEWSVATARQQRRKPHRAARAAERTRLANGLMETSADMPSISMGCIGKKSNCRKPSVSAVVKFQVFDSDLARARHLESELLEVRKEQAERIATQELALLSDDSKFGSHLWIEDAETTAADVTDSAAESSHDSDEVPEPDDVDSFPPLAQVAPKQTKDPDMICDEEKQVENEVSEAKAVGEAEACANAESIVMAAKAQAEIEARAIKAQALADACALKARVESQAQAKAEATLAQTRASEEKRQTPKKTLRFKDAKELDQQRARRQSKQTREERTFQQGLEQMRAQVEAECQEVRERALAEANAAKARAVAEARTIRAKARTSAKVEEQRRRDATEVTEVVAAQEVREDTEVVQEDDLQLELATMRNELDELERALADAPAAVATDAESELVNSSQASVTGTQDAVLPQDVDAEWEILRDSSLESIPGWDVIV